MLSLPMFSFLQSLSLSLVILLCSPLTSAAPDCDCYSTASRSSPQNVFLSHLFLDYRNVTPSGNDDFSSDPLPVSARQDNGTEPVTSSYFNTDAFTQNWHIQTWTQDANASADAPVELVNSAQNVFIASNASTQSTYLTLRTTRQKGFQSACELDSNLSTILHASIRVRARISGSPGAVAGLFTFGDDNNESDIEILTRDSRSSFRATNQPGVDSSGNVVPDASRVVTVAANQTAGADGTTQGKGSGLGNSSYADWNEWRLDWTAEKTEWFVNEVSVWNNSYGVPRKGSQFIMNVWGDGGGWSGEMEVGEQARMDVEWVEMVYNTTDNTGGDGKGGCGAICLIDDVRNVGVPQASMARRQRGGAWALVLGCVLGVVGCIILM